MPRSPHRRYPEPVRAGLAEQVVEHLLQDISSGVYPPEAQLPPEATLAQQTGVSRLTLREAIKGLRQRGVVRVEQGRGTFVNPTTQWLPFDPMLLAARVRRDGNLPLARQLTEVRQIVEVGAADLAARRRTAADLATMRQALERMQEGHDGGDEHAFSAADIDFHLAVLRAVGNEFVGALLVPVDAALREVRTQTSRDRQMKERALTMHRQVYQAIRSRSPRSASRLMERHLQETLDYISRLIEESPTLT